MFVKVKVEIIRSKAQIKEKVITGTMTEIPMINRSFKITTRAIPKKGEKHAGIRIIESTKVTRILCLFPRTIWVQTDLTVFRITVLQPDDRSAATFLRWIPFIRNS